MSMSQMWYLDLMAALNSLKHLKRTGWVKCGVPEPETVACHMYRMAVLAMALEKQIEGCDIPKVTRMSLVHDLAEAVVGDITPHCGVADEDKHELEKKAMNSICENLEIVGKDWFNLWMEYEKQSSLEAVVTKHLDKFDMIVQAYEYEKKYPGLDLSQFFNSTVGVLTLEPFKSWDADLRCRRAELWKSRDCTSNSSIFAENEKLEVRSE